MSAPVLGSGEVVDGRYELGDVLGVGGMSEVFRATDRETGEAVAVKVLRGVDPGFQPRFEREAAVLEQLDDPGIVRLRGSGNDRGTPYLVLDLVEGPSLAERLRQGPLDEAEAEHVGAALATALAHAHAAGVVHRDVKPANVLLAPDGNPKLVDFGVATMVDTTSITVAGTVIGTPTYLAPEQVRGERAGPAADVYALGLVLLESITGRRSFPGTTAESATARLVAPPAIPSTVSPRLAGILAAMTALDPAERPLPAHVAAWLDSAASAAADPDSTVVAEPTMVLPLAAMAPPRRTRRAGIVLAAALAAIVALLLLASSLGSGQAPADAGPATSSTTLVPTTVATTTTAPPTTVPPTTAPPPTRAPKGKGSGNGDNGD